MRILNVTSLYPAAGIPAGVFVHEMARRIASHDHQSIVVAPHLPGAARREVLDGVEVHRFRYAWPQELELLGGWQGGMLAALQDSWTARMEVPGFVTAMAFTAWMRTRHPPVDHILAHWVLPSGLVAWLVSKLSGCRYSVVVHGGSLRAFGERLRPLVRKVIGDATLVLANSHQTADHIRRVSSREQIEFYPMGVDLAKFPYEDLQRPANNELRLLCVGRLVPIKGTRYAIEALRILYQRGLEARLTVVGDGPLRTALQAEARALGLTRRIEFLPYVPHAELAQLYHVSDVLLQPSLHEPLGVALLEAQAAGLNVVASRVDGIPTAVVDGKTGLLVNAGDPVAIADAVARLVHDPALSARMRAEGRAYIERNFSWEMLGGRLVKLLEGAAPA